MGSANDGQADEHEVMRARICILSALLFASASTFAAAQAAIDLSNWKVTLPVDKEGRFDGKAVELKASDIGVRTAPWFAPGHGGAIVFIAPATGATTSGSGYPRSELRELNPDGSLAAWTIERGGTLNAVVSINELPATDKATPGRIVIGQIHGPDDELCRLYYEEGALYFVDDKASDKRRNAKSKYKETAFELKSSSGRSTSIPLNSSFSYEIKVADGKLTVATQHEGEAYSATEVISDFWPGQPLYFKAGVYVQVGKSGTKARTIGTGQAKVTFLSLTVQH
jgi:hypothetical protein